MALQDILDAISAQADQQISTARKTHQKGLTEIREGSERRLATKKQEMNQEKEQRKVQLKAKTQAHAESVKRNALLSRKQDLLNELYEGVTKELANLPPKEMEALLTLCLEKISEKGEIAPAKSQESLIKKLAPSSQFKMGAPIDAAGGFVFSSTDLEYDFTFEHIVSEYLRPHTELDVSQELFTS